MDRSAQNIDRSSDSEIMNLRRMKFLFDRSAQNIDRSSDSEIMNLRRMKFLFDVAPLEIIIDNNDKELLLFDNEEEEDFFLGGVGGVGGGGAAAAAAVGMNINQINLVIHAISHGVIFQYWSLKSDQQQQQLNSSCHGNKHHRDHHRDHHHLGDDDDDEEMIMIACQPLRSPKTEDIVLARGGGVYASAAADDDYIMSLLRDLDILYEIEWIFKPEQLEGVKRCIIQRINESKPAVLLAKPKTVRIRLDLSTIMKKYYANPAAAASAYAQKKLYNLQAAKAFAIHYPAAPPTFYDDDKPSRTPLTTALRSSKEALETKILEEEDLISSSSSSSSCSVCLVEFCVGVEEDALLSCVSLELPDELVVGKEYLSSLLLPITYLCQSLSGGPIAITFSSRFLKDQLPPYTCICSRCRCFVEDQSRA